MQASRLKQAALAALSAPRCPLPPCLPSLVWKPQLEQRLKLAKLPLHSYFFASKFLAGDYAVVAPATGYHTSTFATLIHGAACALSLFIIGIAALPWPMSNLTRSCYLFSHLPRPASSSPDLGLNP
ncbi:hypothetical protein VTK26DRAFT_9420 [Humicola hyalothermophila]